MKIQEYASLRYLLHLDYDGMRNQIYNVAHRRDIYGWYKKVIYNSSVLNHQQMSLLLRIVEDLETNTW